MAWARCTRVGAVAVGPSCDHYQYVDILVNGHVVSLEIDEAKRLANILVACADFQEVMLQNDTIKPRDR